MSTVRILNLRHLRRAPLRAALAVIAVGASVAMTVAGITLIVSLDRSTEAALRNIGGPAPIRVIGPLTRGGATPELLDAVERTPGVGAAVPVVQAAAIAQRSGGRPVFMVAVGIDCRVEALTGSFGCSRRTANLRADGPALISKRLADLVGDNGSIRTDVGRVPIAGAVVNDSLDKVNGGRVAVFAFRTAQRVFERGQSFDAIYVKPEKGVPADVLRARLHRAVGPQNFVLKGTEPAPWMNTRGPLIPLLTLGAVLSLGLSGLLVYNIVSLSLAERRRDLAVASALGTPSRQLFGGILIEAGAIGFAGGVLGIGAGIVIAHPLVSSFASAITEQAMGLKVNVYTTWGVAIVGIVVGVLTAIAAAFVPARRALRLDLAAELHGRGTTEDDAPVHAVRRLAWIGVAAVLTMIVSFIAIRNGGLAPWQPVLGALALIVMSVLVFAGAGTLAPLILATILRVFRSRGGPIRVALANLVSRSRRTAVIATAVGAAVGLACVLGSLVPAIKATVGSSDLGGWTAGHVFVGTLPLNNASNIDARPSRQLVSRLRSVPGVGAIDLERSSEVSDAQGTYSVRNVLGASNAGLIGGFTPVLGDVSADAIERGEAMIGVSLARQRNLRPGSTLRVATPSGFVPLRVAGIWNNAQDNGFCVTVSEAVNKRLFGDVTAHEIFPRTDGVSEAKLAARIEAAHLDPDAFALTPDAATARLADEVGDQVTPFWFLQRLLLFVALIGTLSTLLLVAIQRRREFGMLGAVGFGPSALGAMTVTEALAAGMAGGILGAVLSPIVFEVLRNAAVVAIGVRPEFRLDVGSAPTALALAAVVLVLGAALPAWRTARLQIVEAIRDE